MGGGALQWRPPVGPRRSSGWVASHSRSRCALRVIRAIRAVAFSATSGSIADCRVGCSHPDLYVSRLDEVVTASIASGSGQLKGTLTATASNGVARFSNLQIDGRGPHTLRFTTTPPALSVISATFTVP